MHTATDDEPRSPATPRQWVARETSLWEIFRHPLPDQPFINRVLCRGIVAFARRWVIEARGLEHVAPDRDPFVLAINHNQRPEALLIPTLAIYCRHGQLLHFFADWNFRLIPVVNLIMRRSGIITVTKKDAKPRFLNVFRPLFAHDKPVFDVAADRLAAGASVGIFPEGTVNRDPKRLLPGRPGAARLSIRAQVPVVPCGISFPEHDPSEPIPDGARMLVTFGPSLTPPSAEEAASRSRKTVMTWHHRIMSALSELSGKALASDSTPLRSDGAPLGSDRVPLGSDGTPLGTDGAGVNHDAR